MSTQLIPRAPARPLWLMVFLVAVVLAGAVVLGWAIPPGWDFVRAAPREFWLVAILAIAADSRPFVQRQLSRWPSRTIISVSFTFAIFLLWGAAPAIVVQVVAAAVAALRLRLSAADGAFLVARLVCAFAAAEVTVRVLDVRPDLAIGSEIDRYDVAAVFEPALAWLIVDYGLIFLARVAARRRADKNVRRAIWYDLLGTAGLLLLAPVLVTAPTGWSIAMIAIPLLALWQYSRLFADQERRLNRDPVTNMLSRRGLLAQFEELTATDDSYRGEPRPFGVVLVLLDGFAYINQNLGRELAEKVVREAAQRLRAAVGERDSVGRIGGEVFVVLKAELVEQDALESANALARTLSELIDVDGLPFALDPVVGVALSPQHGRDFSVLVGRAESAATEARSRRVPARVYAQEAWDATEARVALLSDLRAALTDPDRADEIAMLYQPQVDIESGRIDSVEALMRWTHPRMGPVRTDELIEATEPSEVMQLLTRRIIGDVTAQLAAWNEAGIELRAAVNVSVRDLGTEGFEERLRAELARHSVPTAQLQIEITEGTLLADAARLIRVTQSLAAMGVNLALDDFGTGFASLHQLRMFPLTEVKIDRSYIAKMASSPAEKAIVQAIYQLARALDLRVVAEGVEDAQTVELLATMPGIVGQGWYFARAMPASELVEWLRAREEYTAHGWRER